MTGQYFLTGCSLIVALIVTIVAVQQLQLSRQRFKLDLFEKRYNVYKATQIFLTKIPDQKWELSDLFDFRAKTQDSVFLFKDKLVGYLKTIDSKALELWRIRSELEDVPKGEERSKRCIEQTEVLG